jgi:thiol:disulfide interchange protein DsbC
MVKKSVIVMLLGFLFFVPLIASGFTSEHPGCGGDCRDCHSLDKKEAEGIIKKGVPQAKVTDVKMAPIRGLWQVDFDVEGKHGIVFLDFLKKHIVVIQQIIAIDSAGKPEPQRKIDFSRLPLKQALVMGNRYAKKKIVVFTDPDCPFCRKLHVEIKQVLAKRHDVGFYFFLRPLPMHGKDAVDKAQAIICAKSSALLDDALSGRAVPPPSCSTAGKQVEKNDALADSLGLHSTPSLVRDDGMVHTGYLPAAELSSWIDGK